MTVTYDKRKPQFWRSLLECSASFRGWLIKEYVTGWNKDEPSEVQDSKRFDDHLGWDGHVATLEEAWDEWAGNPKNPHFEKNVMVEWTRTDIQRATKMLAFMTVWGTIAGLTVGFVVGVVVAWVL